jgi:hypothetical protein
MKLSPVTHNLFRVLISELSGDRFETLAKRIFGAVYGDEYVALGGMHDGAADGFYLPRVFASKDPTTFFQFSITDSENARTKIIQTLVTLRENERDPKQLIYSTTEGLPKQDLLRTEIFKTYGVLLTIRDCEHLEQLANNNGDVNTAFLHFFAPEIDSLQKSAEALKGAVNQYVQDPTVFAFLDYEFRERGLKDELHKGIVDSLIYWSLRDTDPDKGIY